MIKHPTDRYQRRLIREKKKAERALIKGKRKTIQVPETQDGTESIGDVNLPQYNR